MHHDSREAGHTTQSGDAVPEPPKVTLRRARDVTVEEIGDDIVRVPLAGALGLGRFAIVDRADFDRLMRAGISPCWHLADTGGVARKRYVKVGLTVGGRTLAVSVARLILEADAHGRVKFASKDRLDLRRSNISLKAVAARGEGDNGSGVMRKTKWNSVARDRAKAERKAAERAAKRAAEEAAHRAYLAAQADRVDRGRALHAAQVAAGAAPEVSLAQVRAGMRREREAYCAEHGLDPATGKPPRAPGRRLAAPRT